MQEASTQEVYTKFQWELKYAGAFAVEEIEKNKWYNVKKLMEYEGQEFNRESFLVNVEIETEKYDCICSKFDRDGILCCHVLRLFTQLGIIKIPERYIKPRWTKMWKEEELKKQKQIAIERTGDAKGQSAVRYAMMMGKSAEICASTCKDPVKSNKFIELMEKFQEELVIEEAARKQAQSANSTNSVFQNPPIANQKSVAKGNRLLRPAEKAAAKKKATSKKNSKQAETGKPATVNK